MRELFTQPLRKFIGSLLCVLVLVCAPLQVYGQESSPPSKANETKSGDTPATKKDTPNGAAKASPESLLPPGNTRFFYTKNGETIELPKTSSMEEYDKWKASQNRSKGPQAATISEVAIEGETDEERAHLKVTYTIQLQSDVFESVPLYFNEAVLMRLPTYTGDGREFGWNQKADPKFGYSWWLLGRGQHRLEFHFTVPLRKSLPTRHLSVTLPESPVSRMKLTIPYASVTAKVLREQAVVSVKPDGQGKTEIEAIGLGSPLDLTWQPTIDIQPNEVSLESQTIIRAFFEPDQVLLRADQRINSLQGRFEKVTVRLPTGAEPVKVDDPDKQSFKVSYEDRQQAVITLREKANSAHLIWTLRIPAKIGKPIAIDGFDVDKARKQIGKIGFAFSEGVRLTKPTDPSLLGINAGEFPIDMGAVVSAYQFFSQPFKAITTLEEVKPYFEVHPQLLLTATAGHLTLDGVFEYHVDRDSMSRDSMIETALTWPGCKSEGWTIESINEPGVVESYSPIDDDGQIMVRLTRYRSGIFHIRMRARRQFKAGEEIAFSLPRPKLPSRLSPTKLILANAENVETDLSARGETAFHLLPSASFDIAGLPETSRDLKSAVYQIDTDEQLFALRVTPQKQRVRTESFTDAKWENNQFRIVQHVIYNVAYERLSQVRLSVPPTIDIDRIRFRTDNDVELTPEWLQEPVGEGRQILVKLGEARIGQFEIQARFSIPFSKESVFDPSAIIKFPILTSLDEPFSQTRFSLTQSDWFDAEPESNDTWSPQLNRQESWKWAAEGVQNELRMKLIRSTHSSESGTVSRALIRVQIHGNTGESLIRAQYRLSTRATSLPVIFPDTAQPPIFFWDQQRLSQRDWTESPVGSHRYVVQLPQSEEENSQDVHLLTVAYQDKIASPLTWSDRLELRSPQLPTCSWVQVNWQVILPAGQHLLTSPRSAAPMFRWERTGIVFSRVPSITIDQLQNWVTKDTPGPAPQADTILSDRSGNSYTFSQFDLPKPLVIQTLSSSMALLLGAGFTLVIGFVTLRIAVLRNVLTLLVLFLALAVAGLWYAEPLELLLQPMIAGLILPITAVYLEGAIRKRFDTGPMPFSGQDEFPPMHAFGSHYVIRQADPNEATQHRPVVSNSDSNIPIETGSGVS